jgi:hypothetical protein
MMDDVGCGAIGEMLGRINQVLRENLSQNCFSTINPTIPDPGSNPRRLGGKPATNCLSYGTVLT